MSILSKYLISRCLRDLCGDRHGLTRRGWGARVGTGSFLGLLGVLGGFAAPAPVQAQVQFNAGAGQAYTTIQAAVDKCPAAGCVINLTDSVYAMPREVWIEGKNNLTIQPSAQMKALKIRPRLYSTAANEFMSAGTAANPTDPDRPAGWKMWPNKSTKLTGPGAGGDTGAAANIYSTSGFQSNGYVVVFKSTNVTIDGILVDGKKSATFVNTGIWCSLVKPECYDVFFGNVGINLFESKHVVVRGTEIKNCFAAFYIQNRNVGGAFAAPNPNDHDKKYIVPYSRFGKMGDHLIERNYVHNNWYVFYDEMEWDIGSTIRYNLCDQNYNTQFAQNKDSSSESNNMTGGFMYLKDVRIVPHKIYNNTINGSSIIFGNSYFKPGVQHYFYNNLITGWNRAGKNGAMIKDSRQYLALYKDFLYNNTFEVGKADSLYQLQPAQSGSVNNLAACTLAGQPVASCYLTWTTPVSLITNIKNNRWIWDGWMAEQGVDYQGTFMGAQYTASNTQNMDRFHQGGVIKLVKGLSGTNATIDISKQANYWAREIPFKSKTPYAAGFLEPVWDSSIVDSTVKDQGWEAAGNLDLDGSVADRGAISAAGNGIISPLTLKDQFIVTLDKVAKTVSFQYCLDAQGVASNLDFELTSYYKTIALSSDADPVPTPAFPAAVQLKNLGALPKANSCGIFKANLPTAPVDSFARFDLVIKGMVDGKPTKSNVGVWVWRETLYKLDVYFTKSPAGNDTITTARVGESVYMHVVGRRADNNSAIPALDVLAATPDQNMFLLNPARKQVMPGDTIGKNLAGGKGDFNVEFTSTGTVTIAMSGMVGNLPVPGAGAINIRPGLPYQAIWQSPPDWMYANRAISLDSSATIMDQAPTAIGLQVVDKYGNNVDMVAKVRLAIQKIDPLPLTQGFSALAAGPFTETLFSSDSTGKVTGFNMLTGIEGQKFWGLANVDGLTVIDSALMKVGKPRAQLFFNPAGKIDTFVTVARKVHLILSKSGTIPEVADPQSNSMVSLRTALGSKLYATPTSTIALDSVALVAGEIDIWVRSNVPISNDTIWASNPWIGNGVAAIFAPVTFRMPPKPDAPEPDFGTFLDADCDGKPDSIFVQWQPLGPTVRVATLDTSKVQIMEVHLYYGADSVVLNGSAVRLLPTAAGGVGLSLPLTAKGLFGIYNPTAKMRIFASLKRSPVADTVVQLGAVVTVKDGVAPRPISALLVENPTPAIVADTLTVEFSEPMTYSGSKWPFVTLTPGLTPIPANELMVLSTTQLSPTSIKFVLSGNTLNSLIEKTVLAIKPASGLVDASSNDTRYGPCGGDIATVAIKPVTVAVVSSAILDKNGDGKPDFVRVVFRRDFRKTTEIPDSLVVSNWIGASVLTLKLRAVDSVSIATYELPLPGSFPVGATSGTGPLGSGSLDVYRGVISGINPAEHVVLADSVAPIAVGEAKIEFGATADQITVHYSEPMKIGNANAEATMVLKSASGDLALTFTGGTPDATQKVWTFQVAVGKLQVGDSIRLPAGDRSVLKADNGASPSSLGAAPYVPVVGGDRAPDSGLVLDRNGDGIADAIRLFYTKAPVGNPSFSFTWGGKTVSVDSLDYQSVVAGKTDVTFAVAGFAYGTSGTASANSKSYVSGAAVAPIVFVLKDGVAPVLESAFVSYGMAENAADTLRLKMSESATLAAVADQLISVRQKGANALLPAGSLQLSGSDEFTLICQAPGCQVPGFGDSARLAKGSATDRMGAVVGDSSRLVAVTTGPKPIRYQVSIYPNPVLAIDSTPDNPLRKLDPLSAWVRMDGAVDSGWTAIGATAEKWKNNNGMATMAELSTGLVGLKLELNASFDGQFLAYDNMGVFLGKADIKIDIKDLKAKGLASASNKYALLVGLNGVNRFGKQLAYGVYMIRVIGYTEQVVNGQVQRVMAQNRVYKVGMRSANK